MEKLKDSKRILGIIIICFALFDAAKIAFHDIELIGLTPDKCTVEVEGISVDYVLGSKMQYGGSVGGHAYDVYYDVIEYEANGQKYQITSRHASVGDPVIGAQITVHYNPNNPAKAYDNSPPSVDSRGYYYSVMILFIGLVLVFRLDQVIGKR